MNHLTLSSPLLLRKLIQLYGFEIKPFLPQHTSNKCIREDFVYHVHSINLMRKIKSLAISNHAVATAVSMSFSPKYFVSKNKYLLIQSVYLQHAQKWHFSCLFFFGESFYKWNGVYVVWAMPLSTRLCLHNVPLCTPPRHLYCEVYPLQSQTWHIQNILYTTIHYKGADRGTW